LKDQIDPGHWLSLALSLLCQVTAVVFAKQAALSMEGFTPGAFLTSPWYLACIGCLVLQAFFWQIVLRRIRLFVAYLVTSLNYFLILIASRVFFAEQLTLFHFAGAALIVAGVFGVVREDVA